jgi:hypothetical protein
VNTWRVTLQRLKDERWELILSDKEGGRIAIYNNRYLFRVLDSLKAKIKIEVGDTEDVI